MLAIHNYYWRRL